MEERTQRIIGINTLGLLKALTLTVECEEDEENGMYIMQAKEFPYAVEYDESYAVCREKLIRSLKEWAMNLAADFESWKAGREHEIPYLLMLLISSESEINECLRYEK